MLAAALTSLNLLMHLSGRMAHSFSSRLPSASHVHMHVGPPRSHACGACAQAMQVGALLSLGQFQLGALLEGFLGGVVGLPVSHLTVTDLVLAPGASIGAGTQEVALRADLVATPADSYSAAVVRFLVRSLGARAESLGFMATPADSYSAAVVCLSSPGTIATRFS